MAEILVLYYSRNGSVKQMAKFLGRGIEMVPNVSAKVRTVPLVSPTTKKTEPLVPEDGAPYVEIDDVLACDGLAIGSPTRFGNMAAPMKYFVDQLGGIWHQGALEGKPATVFTSAGSMHGGQESTLITMLIPLLHLGMLITGVPYSVRELNSTRTGGTPYGASHLAGAKNEISITDEEKTICIEQGRRLGTIASRLKPR